MTDIRPEAVGVTIEGVSLSFGTTQVLKGVSLTIEPGEFFTFLGPSGSGKSTLLRAIAGFGPVPGGSILIGGDDVTHLAPWHRNVGMVFQSYALWPHMTVRKNVAFGLEERKIPARDIRGRVDAALGLIGLLDLADRRPSQLSGGQQQRVALARTIVVEPRVLLLDEPLSNLDANLRIQMRREILELQRKLKLTTIFVTHDQEEAMTVASRVAVMDEGQIIQVATPGGIYEAPNSVYVADFIGDVNIISGTVKAAGENMYHLDWVANEAPLLAASERPFSDGQEAHLAIRPEKIAISTEKPTEMKNAVQGTVLDIAYLGNLSTYHVQLAGGQVIKAQTANTRRLSRRTITWEDKVWISWSATAGVLLER